MKKEKRSHDIFVGSSDLLRHRPPCPTPSHEKQKLDLAEPVDVSLTTTLPLETIPDTASVVEALAIQFYTIGAEGKLKPVIDGAAGFVVSVF